MKLSELMRGVETAGGNVDGAIEITSVCADSRLVRKGSLFVAIAGFQQDGTKFIDQAVQKGAAAVVTENVGQALLPVRTGTPACPTPILVRDARTALAVIAANFYGRPADKLSLVGVTGTSGKTTTTKMIESILDAT
ncbi:MAG TPA: Mur ligase domain-containing protein, partial [Thermoanaerobaculia bacterium]